MYKASIIAMEGVDSVGKETQTKKLKQKLESEGYRVKTFTFPNYDSPTGRAVKDYLQGMYGDASAVPPELASALYAQDRSASLSAIMDAICHNDFVIMDRYVYSNLAFQGGKIECQTAKEGFFKRQMEIEFGTLGLPKPDLTFFLDAAPQKTRTLLQKRGGESDDHERNMKLLTEAYNSYRTLSKLPEVRDRWIDIAVCFNANRTVGDNGIRPINAIAEDIYAFVKTVF